MLLSELEERGRRFKLALRTGIPILILIALIIYSIFLKDSTIVISTKDGFMIAGIVFASIYFIYFLIEQDSKETLLDHETHGFNQKAFEKKLKKTQSKTISLLIVNNLSLINENYGTEEASKLLQNSIQRLNQTLNNDGLKKAIIGRKYGAEFLIAINEHEDLFKASLKNFIENNHTVNGIDIDYRFAVVTYKNEDLEKTITLLKDKMSSSQKSGIVSEEKLEIKDISEISKIENEISEAIKHKSLSFTFRPLLNAKTKKIEIYEISIKLKSNEYGNILPRTYLPIVNRLGLGREYDFAIVRHLIDILPLLDESISLTFNISPFSLRNREFQNRLFDYLDKSNINASRLIIELYERKAHHDLSNYFQTLNYMRAKGLRIAIDNFGSSNASIEYMKHFRFDMVQFDRDYVTKLDDRTTFEMLRSLVNMSKKLDIKTIAKWVDKESQKQKLEELGIDYLQGFGIGKHISEKELISSYN